MSELPIEDLGPSKVIRLGTMISQVLEEIRRGALDASALHDLTVLYHTTVEELNSVLSPDLGMELDRLSAPFEVDSDLTESELRIAEAQLFGWLYGVLQGFQLMLKAAQAEYQNEVSSTEDKELKQGQYM